MALITDYSSLQSTIADWLNRSDLTAAIQNFIQNAERELARDERVRSLKLNTAFVVDEDSEAVPNDLDRIDSWYHDGAVHFGEIETVPASRLGILKAQFGTSGVPRFAARIPDKIGGTDVFRFAPVPDGAYTTVLTYYPKLVALTDTAPTNWLVANHPDIYLYAALVESAPYLKDDPRVAVWRQELERRLESLHQHTQRQEYSGTLRRRPRRPIGG